MLLFFLQMSALSQFLFLDTSRKKANLAFFGKKSQVISFEALSNLSSHILNEISQFSLDFQAILVTKGPGLFTGTRVGGCIAKTLSFSLGIPLIGISALKIFEPLQEGAFFCLTDAKGGKIFVIEGKKTSNGLSFDTQETLCDVKDFFSSIDKNSLLISPDEALLSSYLPQQFPPFNPYRLAMKYLTDYVNDHYAKKSYSLDGSLDLIYKNSL